MLKLSFLVILHLPAYKIFFMHRMYYFVPTERNRSSCSQNEQCSFIYLIINFHSKIFYPAVSLIFRPWRHLNIAYCLFKYVKERSFICLQIINHQFIPVRFAYVHVRILRSLSVSLSLSLSLSYKRTYQYLSKRKKNVQIYIESIQRFYHDRFLVKKKPWKENKSFASIFTYILYHRE